MTPDELDAIETAEALTPELSAPVSDSAGADRAGDVDPTPTVSVPGPPQAAGPDLGALVELGGKAFKSFIGNRSSAPRPAAPRREPAQAPAPAADTVARLLDMLTAAYTRIEELQNARAADLTTERDEAIDALAAVTDRLGVTHPRTTA